MERFYERRNGRNVPYYVVSVDDRMKRAAMGFAQKIIDTDNQYSRLLPIEVRMSNDLSVKRQIEIQRTYIGKLGEAAFAKFLHEKGKRVNLDGMFDIFEGQTSVDSFDFMTAAGKTVDIKTGFREIHKRLLVNTEQFKNIPKDYYVAVKLDAVDIDSSGKLVDLDNISNAAIIGYADYNDMQTRAATANFGEAGAKWLYYNSLNGIDGLLNLF